MDEYAPLYSKRERLRLLLITTAGFTPLFLLAHFWFAPWIANYARYANCYDYGDINGMELLLYGIFVGIPLSFGLLVLLLFGWRSWRVIAAGQDPLPGEKVLRKTRYRYGRTALILPSLTVTVVVLTIGASIWGGFQAEKLTRNISPCNQDQKIELGINN